MDFSPSSKVCSFCGKHGTPDTRFVGGLGAMMCVECLERYHERLQSPAEVTRMRRPPWEEMSDAELLATLPALVRSAEQANRFIADWVDLIRERHVSWAAIGAALGVSRQAAWERFGGRADGGRKAAE